MVIQIPLPYMHVLVNTGNDNYDYQQDSNEDSKGEGYECLLQMIALG